nr:MAG TPA: hypothetical protein [Caudoviricetes sp.]
MPIKIFESITDAEILHRLYALRFKHYLYALKLACFVMHRVIYIIVVIQCYSS